MASGGKKKTTMAKLTRESRLRERRQDKLARKNARKLAAANGTTEDPLEPGLEGDPLDDDVDGAEVVEGAEVLDRAEVEPAA